MRVLLAMLLLAVVAPAAPADPGAAAVAFVQQVCDGTVSLEPGAGLAFSPHTLPDKRKEILRRLHRLADELKGGTFTPAATRTDGELAAVVVTRTVGFDAGHFRAVSVALVKSAEGWLPAPVPASFENSGLGYAPALRRRTRALEDWMLAEQTRLVNQAIREMARRMQAEIAASLPPAKLRAMSADAAAQLFLDACAEARLPVLLGLLGGLPSTQPDDWSARVAAATAAATARTDAAYPWRLLTAPTVVRAVVETESEPDTGMITLVCIDPFRRSRLRPPPFEFVVLPLERTADDLWQLNPPDEFFNPPDQPAPQPDYDEEEDEELLDQVTVALRKTVPAAPQATPEATTAALRAALLAPTPLKVLSLLDFTGPPATARAGIALAIQCWARCHEHTGRASPVLLDQAVFGDTGVVACTMFTPQDPRLVLQLFYLERDPAGWHLLSGLVPDEVCKNRFAEATAWAARQSERWEPLWREHLLREVPRVVPSSATPPPSAESARELLEKWWTATAASDLTAPLPLACRLDGPASAARLLRQLGYEQTPRQERPIITTARGTCWTLVAARPPGQPASAARIYPVVTTPAGPRILLEAQLGAGTDSIRDLLNRETLTHLREVLPDPTVDELRELAKQLHTTP